MEQSLRKDGDAMRKKPRSTRRPSEQANALTTLLWPTTIPNIGTFEIFFFQ